MTSVAGLAAVITVLFIVGAGLMFADGPALRLRATVIGAGAPTAPMTIELLRWSTDVERAPLLAALSAPPPPPPSVPAAPAGGRAGRAGRGGRGAAPPPSPLARLTTAVKAAPTVGFIWGDGPTGYSIKYAWRSLSPDGQERVVLATDRRLGAHSTSWASPSGLSAEALAKAGVEADAEFTVMEMRIDGKGAGEAKTSQTSSVVIDAAANTLALDGYDAAPVLFKVTR